MIIGAFKVIVAECCHGNNTETERGAQLQTSLLARPGYLTINENQRHY